MYSYKKIWKLSYPIAIGLLAQNIINVVNTAFLGRVGEIELGASALGGLYYICVFTIIFGFSIGAQIIIGRRNGESNHHEIGPIVIQGIVFLFILSLALLILSYLYSGHIMRIMISSDIIWDAAMTYLNWRIIGFLFDGFNVMFRAFFVGIGRTKILIINAFIMTIVNVILDYLLIFGNFGFPEMGLKGAAIASIIAEFSSTLFFILYAFSVIDRKKYSFSRIKKLNFELIRQILSISLFTMMQYFISMSTFFLFFIVIERHGQHSLAIANIVRSIYVVMLIPINALSVAANTLVSNIIGEGKKDKVIPLIKRISGLTFIIMTFFSILLIVFAKPVLAIYTNSESLIVESAGSVYVIAIVIIINSISYTAFNGISGTGNTRSAFAIEIVVLIVYTFYIYLMGISYKFPVDICFTSEFIYSIGLLTGSILYLHFADWQKKKI
jgi:putative MATE family efflux protein